jgi:hypothetical protein
MRKLQSLVVLLCLCLFLGASAASAAEAPAAPAGREAGGLARIVGHLGALLKAVWENEAGENDPWGRVSPNAGAPASAGSATASADLGCDIDPFGRCSH